MTATMNLKMVKNLDNGNVGVFVFFGRKMGVSWWIFMGWGVVGIE